MGDSQAKPSASGRDLQGWLELIALVLIIAVALALLYRLIRPAESAVAVAAAGRPPAPGVRAVPPEPPLPSEPLSLEHAALLGDPKAPVAIVAFSDFQCPYCRVFAQDIWPAVQKQFVETGQVQVAFRHLPLDSLHPLARRIAAGAECARQQGRFWEFHDALFARQRELAQANLGEMAAAVGVTASAFTACLDGEAAAGVVLADSSAADGLGVSGTPTFFVGRVTADGRVQVTQRIVGAKAVEVFAKAVADAAAVRP
jgi:protein-disulfide isomerase